jgi:hypothetical protein
MEFDGGVHVELMQDDDDWTSEVEASCEGGVDPES